MADKPDIDLDDYRIRFIRDEGATGEDLPKSPEEYEASPYMGCMYHWCAGVTPDGACRTCGRRTLHRLPYHVYLAYYGDPAHHVCLQAEVQQRCPHCRQWQTLGGTCGIDFMDRDPEVAVEGVWFSATEVNKLPGYLREVALQDLAELTEDKTCQ